MKLSVLFRGGAVATLVAAMLLVGGSRQANAVETKTVKKAETVKKVEKIDLNKATSAQLETLPGIGAATAKKIIDGRPYKSVDDLSKAGISATEIRKLNSLVSIGATPAPATVKDAKSMEKTAKEGKAVVKTTKPGATTSKPAIVDLNKGTSDQLEGLPGIGPALAKKIVAGRPYKSVADLSKAGISATEIHKIESLVTVGAMVDSPVAKTATKDEKPLTKTAPKDSAKQTHTVAKPVIGDTKPRAIDVNTASESTLEGVSGIGSAYAKKIVDGRPYKSIDDLTKAGIPQSTVDKIRTHVAVGRPFEAPPEKGMVWVNLDSKRYHKETSAWYGRTKNGKYMSEADAVKAGYTAANMKVKKS
jgi:DNA uptake protein ComE-like DNA-binding protein